MFKDYIYVSRPLARGGGGNPNPYAMTFFFFFFFDCFNLKLKKKLHDSRARSLKW